ncbi:hypothetical protein PENSPDRAFT_645392 [Peniophora sp. CONT]|nr:hypothetical protein PENSPDRAFT_645392 [Peniophora sp. CONT]
MLSSGEYRKAPINSDTNEQKKREIEELKSKAGQSSGSAELDSVRVAEKQARDATTDAEQDASRVQGHIANVNERNSTAAQTVEQLQAENEQLKAVDAERAAAVVQLEKDAARLQQSAAADVESGNVLQAAAAIAASDKILQLERRISELSEVNEKLEREAEELKLAQVHPAPAPDDSTSDIVQELRQRIAELEARLAQSEKRVQMAKNNTEAVGEKLLHEQEKARAAQEIYEREITQLKGRLKNLDIAHRILQGREEVLQNEFGLTKQQCLDARNAVKDLEQKLRDAQIMAVGGAAPVPEPTLEPMDVDGPPELPSLPSSPVVGPAELGEVRQRNRRLSQHNDTLRAGQTKLEQDIEALRAENERLEAENARYEPFVLSSEQRDGELEALTVENAALCRSIERFRTLRDRGLLSDLKNATAEELVPSSELTNLLVKNMGDVFAGIDVVLADTAQRKFTIVDRAQPPSASLSRRTSMVFNFKQPTRPSTPAHARAGSTATQNFSAAGRNTSATWTSATADPGWS